MRNKWVFNPFIWYATIWTLILFLYQFQFSNLYTELDLGLGLTLITTILLSIVCAIIFQMFLNKHQFKFRDTSYYYEVIGIISLGFIMDYAYARHVPLLDELLHTQYTYMDFSGIPTFHVFLLTFVTFYATYTAYLFLYTENKKNKKKYVIGFFIMMAWLVTLYNRAILLMIAFMCVLIYLSKVKITVKRVIIVLVLAIVALYGFGIFGNIRMGSTAFNTDYISAIAEINEDKYPSWLSRQFIWAYVYLVSPLGNLNYNVKCGFTSFDMTGIMVSFVPDALSKRLFAAVDTSTPLVTEYLTVSSAFSSVYKFGGLTGILVYFAYACVFIMVFACLTMRKTNSFIPVISVLCCMVIFMFFVNTFTYTGLSFAIFYPLVGCYFNVLRRDDVIKMTGYGYSDNYLIRIHC